MRSEFLFELHAQKILAWFRAGRLSAGVVRKEIDVSHLLTQTEADEALAVSVDGVHELRVADVDAQEAVVGREPRSSRIQACTNRKYIIPVFRTTINIT